MYVIFFLLLVMISIYVFEIFVLVLVSLICGLILGYLVCCIIKNYYCHLQAMNNSWVNEGLYLVWRILKCSVVILVFG